MKDVLSVIKRIIQTTTYVSFLCVNILIYVLFAVFMINDR